MNKMLRCMLSLSLLVGPLLADGPAAAPKSDDATTATPDKTNPDSEMAKLKAKLAEQQAQIEKLAKTLEAQSKLLDALTAGNNTSSNPSANPGTNHGSNFPSIGSVASTTPMAPPPPSNTFPAAATVPSSMPKTSDQAGSSSGNPCEDAYDVSGPYLRLGSTCITPVGFMDFTGVWRDKDAASGIGTNFGSIPYNNAALGNLSELHMSPQNSRIGFRIDGEWKGAHFIGYNEFDFLGTSGNTNLTVTNGAFVPRLRLFWVDVRKGQWEILGGQSWSMLTPNRSGISPLPSDIFYSQAIDVNYMAGLTWTRQPGLRVVYHPSDKVALGFAAENPDQYVGGSAGGSSVTLPSALSIAGAGGGSTIQFDNGNNIGTANPVLAAPNLTPDFIVKLAIDPTSRFHFEVAGIARTFQDFNSNTTGLGAQQHFKTEGGGLQFGMNAAILPNLRFITTNFWSDGGGRYLFGQAPDVVVHSDGSLSAVHADGTVDGFELAATKNLLLYAYYGGIYIGRQDLIDIGKTTPSIGYGYPGSANSQNRSIDEVSFGFNQTIWKNPKYGAINFMGQYAYVFRDPWYVAAGAPKGTHDNTIYLNLRYTLPGQAPTFK
jgi:hypothetical protein